MVYRPAIPQDESALRALHSGHVFEFPDISAPDMASVWVAEEDGSIVGAVIARKTVEVTALMDSNFSTPAWRLEVLQQLQQHGARDLARQGFTDMHSWVKAEIRGFGRRLQKNLGWIRSQGGDCFVRSTQ